MYDGPERYTTDEVSDGTIDLMIKVGKVIAFLAGAVSLYFLATITFK